MAPRRVREGEAREPGRDRAKLRRRWLGGVRILLAVPARRQPVALNRELPVDRLWVQ